MCARLAAALANPSLGYNPSHPDGASLAFIEFFATPIDGLDEMAAAVIAAEGATYSDLATATRLLQEYELLFWDACYAAC